MTTGMAGVWLISAFVFVSCVLLLWKLVGLLIDEMKYRNNRD